MVDPYNIICISKRMSLLHLSGGERWRKAAGYEQHIDPSKIFFYFLRANLPWNLQVQSIIPFSSVPLLNGVLAYTFIVLIYR